MDQAASKVRLQNLAGTRGIVALEEELQELVHDKDAALFSENFEELEKVWINLNPAACRLWNLRPKGFLRSEHGLSHSFSGRQGLAEFLVSAVWRSLCYNTVP